MLMPLMLVVAAAIFADICRRRLADALIIFAMPLMLRCFTCHMLLCRQATSATPPLPMLSIFAIDDVATRC